MTPRTLAAILLLLFAPATGLCQPHTISIDVPRDLAQVPWRACLSGTTSDPDVELVAVVHPTEVSSFFVQPVITIREGGRYEVLVYVGESTPGLHAGKHFEIRLFSRPDRALREGMILSRWPRAQAVSPLVRVVRNDDAPSGCGEAVPTSVNKDVTSFIVDRGGSPRSVVLPTFAPPEWGDGRAVGRFVAIAYCVIVVLFVALVAIPERATVADERMCGWLEAYRSWLVAVALKFAVSVHRLWNWLLEKVGSWARPIWSAKGYDGTFRGFAVCALMVPLLAAATVYAFYADAVINVKSLTLVFGMEENQKGSARPAGILNGLMRGAETKSPEEAQQHLPSEKTNLVLVWKEHWIKSFQMLWAEKLGFWAIALAGLQGAFGVVLLWRMRTDQATRLRPLPLFRERPLLTTFFLILNLALVVLAANRGFEATPNGSNWIMPALVSAAIALVMPWVMTFTLHYAIECAVDCVAFVKAVAFVSSMVLAPFCTIFGWVLISLFVVSAVAIVFAAFFLMICVPSCAFLRFAHLIGEFMGKLQRAAWPDLRLSRAGRAIPASLAVLVLVGGGYYVLRGVIQ